jgi:hypothetical protein
MAGEDILSLEQKRKLGEIQPGVFVSPELKKSSQAGLLRTGKDFTQPDDQETLEKIKQTIGISAVGDKTDSVVMAKGLKEVFGSDLPKGLQKKIEEGDLMAPGAAKEVLQALMNPDTDTK